ncbi:MAG: hypothetical protein BGO43_11320 [Gammaproteobacteria bacterium 39-13]|nr:hypothetical protein [Gammaproteobacteria bacterium]OJV85224.1 MAG: hypothetical protein BGO43_11320 [Gammaproteobacteria bacterium 39-13]
MYQKIVKSFIDWITVERPNTDFPLCDYERIRYELRPCDVLLIEGRSRISEVIKQITQSSWSHACLYIGRLHDIDDVHLREKLSQHFQGDPDVQLVIEGYLGKGTIVSPLDNYKMDHIRICRPRGLSRKDAQQVLAFGIQRLGTDYNFRQLFDLARFLIPWSFMPSRWRSSLFEFHVGEQTRTVCSTMIAEAFSSIDFPILPVVKQHEESGLELFVRNPRLITPRDFDYSPYFEIIKFPFISFTEGPYRSLPWNRQGLFSHDGENISDPSKPPLKTSEKLKLKFKLKNKVLDNKKESTEKEPSPPAKNEHAGSSTTTPDEDPNPASPHGQINMDLFSFITMRFTQFFNKKNTSGLSN